MKITGLTIENFKSIRALSIEDIENAFIVVGKNSTGKTAILDAVLLVAGRYPLRLEDFNEAGKNIQIRMTLDFSEEDLKMLNAQGVVSHYKRYDIWLKDFKTKLPGFVEGKLTFEFIANKDKKIRYVDGAGKHNKYIPQVMPRIHYIEHRRDIGEIQSDIFMSKSQESLKLLRDNRCMFDASKACHSCFQCIGMIEKKTPAQLSVFESAKLLEYKLMHMNMEDFVRRLNQNFCKNSGLGYDLMYMMDFEPDQIFRPDMAVYDRGRETLTSVEGMSTGLKSIYILSLLETYTQEAGVMPSIIMIEDPESYLHPQMQKAAGEILYRLSKKNQVVFSTHAPAMIFNFNSRQIHQVVLDDQFCTIIRPRTDINRVLNDLGYTANDLLNVSFVFIVEGKQDRNRLPLLLQKYYSEIYDESGRLNRIAIIATNSCTNIKTYANLKYMNQLYLKDQFLMIRDGDGKDPKTLQNQLCSYYTQREAEDPGQLPRVTPRNVLILKYYSFENYFLDPKVMTAIGVVDSEEHFYTILWDKYQQYLHRLVSFKHMAAETGINITCKEDLKTHMETIRIYGRGHNLYDIFYGPYKGTAETEILKAYIDHAPKHVFQDILEAIDRFIYFQSRIRPSE